MDRNIAFSIPALRNTARSSCACLHERKWNGSIWNRSKTSTDRPCVYTGTVGTVPVWICYPCSFGSATETVPFGTVPFGSRVNGQNRMEPSQKRTDRNRGYYAMR